MQSAFLLINGVRTNVLTYGRWVEESPKGNSTDPEDIVLLIPGNPGLTGFYRTFMQTIYEQLGCPVWIVGHAGHEIPQNDCLPPLHENEELYGLDGQIKHKVDFIEKYVPRNARLHLIGHSIGAYMILELLNVPAIKSRGNVNDVTLLFPTIENMLDSTNGKFMRTFIKPIWWLVLLAAWVFNVIPTFLQTFLLYVYMKLMRIPRMHRRTIRHLINPLILEHVDFLCCQEFVQVKERNNEVIKGNVDRIKIYYGFDDGWTPMSYFKQIKQDIPGIDAEVLPYSHAFVLRESREVGNLVVKRINIIK